MTYKKIRLLFIAAGVGALAYLIFGFIKMIVDMSQLSSTEIATVRTIPSEYLNIFNIEGRGLIANKFTDLNTTRHPISHFDYDHNKYFIVMNKIDIAKDISLNKLINVAYQRTNVSLNVAYLGVSEFNVYFSYLPVPVKTEEIQLNLNGDSIEEIAKSDSIVNYYLHLESVSLRYKKNGLNDLVLKAKSDEVPASILFLKRKKIIYVIYMSNNYDDILPRDLLYNLMVHRVSLRTYVSKLANSNLLSTRILDEHRNH